MDMLISLRIWLRNGFHIKTTGSLLLTFRLPVMYSPYSPGYDASNIPMYKIHSWRTDIYAWKITATILYYGNTLGYNYSKCVISKKKMGYNFITVTS